MDSRRSDGKGTRLKILAVTDGNPNSLAALDFAADLAGRLGSDIAVVTVRAGTHATEEPPPVGIALPPDRWQALPPGICILVDAIQRLIERGLVAPYEHISIREVSHGYLFVGYTPGGRRIPFYERYGHFVEELNHTVDRDNVNLVVVAPPRRRALGRLLMGDTARLLALELHTSLLVVRGGDLESRFLVCVDGSPSSRRLFPLLRHLLPAVQGPVNLMWAQSTQPDPDERQNALQCLQHAREWLQNCGQSTSVQQPRGDRPLELILAAAGKESVVVMGASLRHDVYRRMLGSLTIRVLARTAASVLLVKLPPEADTDFFKDPFAC